ncbi:hypothetical protein ACIQOW_03760 [Kitasatospora sp. NPDC091335]|uniref:hypothetical protein n=1 Tax=Kitasatospora sp. NPDC091335 TaxID=3364085 RepID=UPI003800D669
MTAQWKRLVDHVMGVPEGVYEGWNARDGYDNDNPWGRRFGENGVAWCVIWDWCMYDDVGLAGVVPRFDNVSAFTAWAQRRGQFSQYPSVGAWVNFGNGSHTEIVVGFDADTVYTKGGNSVRAGSTDAGQGNGVWSHATSRRSARVVGYFAPRFPDGVCPPTTDPRDPRGGRAQTSYRWTGADPAPAPTPVQEDDMTPDELLATRVPLATLPTGYVPTVAELLNGAKTAGAQLDQLRADLPGLLLATPMPDYAVLPDGYRPTIGEALNGAKTAGAQLAALSGQVAAQSAAITALAQQVAAGGPVDVDDLVARIEQAISSVTVHLTTTSKES